MAAIINTKATMAKRALTSLMSYGALNKGFWSAMVIKYINANNYIILILIRSIKKFLRISLDKKSHKKWLLNLLDK